MAGIITHHRTQWKNPHGPHIFIIADDFEITRSLQKKFQQYDKAIVLCDNNISSLGVKIKGHILKKLEIPVFQKTMQVNTRNKDWAVTGEIIQFLLDSGATRKTLLIAIGGGSIQDPVGFAASIYMRGIDYMVIPTTYMSIFDGVIGKVGVNFSGRKNLIGSFYSPKFTIVIPSFVDSSLSGSKKSFLFGLVEVWKQAVVTANDDLRSLVMKQVVSMHEVGNSELVALASENMAIKASFVHKDWFDRLGYHKALSFGHTIANYLEENFPLHHGEAVTYGMLVECQIAFDKGLITKTRYGVLVKELKQFIRNFEHAHAAYRLLLSPKLIESLRSDKISSHNSIKLILPTDTGYEISEVAPSVIEHAVKSIPGVMQQKKQSFVQKFAIKESGR